MADVAKSYWKQTGKVPFYPKGYKERNWAPIQIPKGDLSAAITESQLSPNELTRKYFVPNSITEGRWGEGPEIPPDYGMNQDAMNELIRVGKAGINMDQYEKELLDVLRGSKKLENDTMANRARKFFDYKTQDYANRIYKNPTDAQRIALWNGQGRVEMKRPVLNSNGTYTAVSHITADANNHARKVFDTQEQMISPENRQFYDFYLSQLARLKAADSVNWNAKTNPDAVINTLINQ